MTALDTVDLTGLRKPFAPELVGKLPRVTCRACSDGRCGDHRKNKCAECGNYISERHIHIDYVGHADVTDRLLSVDPEWDWQPKAEDEHGLPLFDTDKNGNPVGLWIKLTVGGVTRLGYGSCPSNQNDAVKVLIGDALRNAAMRFGVALDLWAKGDRADPTAENATASAGQASRRGQSAADAFENARPRPMNQGPRTAAAEAIDHDAQTFADKAHKASVPAEIEAIHREARKAGKVAALIRNPAGGGTGKLAVYLDWKRKQLMAAPRLDPEDSWAPAIKELDSAEAAEVLLQDLIDQRGRGEIDPERAAVIEKAIEQAVAARFPTAAGEPVAA
jgi:hypothetical protein